MLVACEGSNLYNTFDLCYTQLTLIQYSMFTRANDVGFVALYGYIIWIHSMEHYMDTLYGYIIWIHTKRKYTSAIIITTIRSYHFQLIYYSIRVDSLYLYRTVLRL